MQKKQARNKRTIIFKANLDFQKTFDHFENKGITDSRYITERGIMHITLKDWEPNLIQISPQGSVTCYYYEGPSDLNKIVASLPEGWAYAHPECTAVNAIVNALNELLIPIEGEELSVSIKSSSLDAETFYQLRNWRQEKQCIRFEGGIRYVCDCGKEFKRETWFNKHIKTCDQFDKDYPHMNVGTAVFAKPRIITVVGLATCGLKTRGDKARIFGEEEVYLWFQEEEITMEMLKKAVIRQPRIPIYLGIPARKRWDYLALETE